MGGIYSYSTARAYNRNCQEFARYVREHSPTGRNTSLEDAFQYAKPFIQEKVQGGQYSASTLKAKSCALGKLYEVPSKTFGETGDRKRADITRSRNRTIISEKTGKEILNPNSRAGHFSERKHSEIVEFAKGTGCRRFELKNVKGSDLRLVDDKPYLHIIGKGGRERLAPIRGEHVQEIVERCRSVGDNERVWKEVPAAMDVHHYRSQYATIMYNEKAREMKDIPKEDRYCCRGDLKGVWYDKKAMLEVSQALGHNRINVIASNYIRS